MAMAKVRSCARSRVVAVERGDCGAAHIHVTKTQARSGQLHRLFPAWSPPGDRTTNGGRPHEHQATGRLYAFDDLSTSDGAPLSSGLLTGAVIMSPCDAARFDIATGKPVGSPATKPLTTYAVRERNGRIEAELGA